MCVFPDPYFFNPDPDPGISDFDEYGFKPNFFSFSIWGPIFTCLDLGPDPDWESGSADPLESRSNPDPIHWFCSVQAARVVRRFPLVNMEALLERFPLVDPDRLMRWKKIRGHHDNSIHDV
jgi:hypothetical protein